MVQESEEPNREEKAKPRPGVASVRSEEEQLPSDLALCKQVPLHKARSFLPLYHDHRLGQTTSGLQGLAGLLLKAFSDYFPDYELSLVHVFLSLAFP